MSSAIALTTDTLGDLRVVVESVEGSAVASVAWLLPVGRAGDPVGAAGEGEATVLSDVVQRGAGSRDSRQWCDAMDIVGAIRSVTCGTHHIPVVASFLPQHAQRVFELIADLVLRPRIDSDGVEAARANALQALRSLRDDPQQMVSVKSLAISMPAPFNRSGLGTEEGLNALTADGLRAAWARRARPGGSIVGVAGGMARDEVLECLRRVLDGWSGPSPEPPVTAPALGGVHFERQDSAQTHMCLALEAPRAAHAASLAHRLAVRVLGGGGMANRLFTEVREKRGLCYSVGMNYGSDRDRGSSTIYAGSTPERAKETLECIRGELAKMERGVSREEFDRAILGLKSSTIMNGERSGARAAAITGDVYRLGRARTLETLVREIDGLTLDQVNDECSRAFTPARVQAATLAVVGPAAL